MDFVIDKADYQVMKDLLRHWGREADDDFMVGNRLRWMVETSPKDSMVNCNVLEDDDDITEDRPGRVVSLRCGTGNGSIPSAIAKLTNLHTLDLSQAAITALPTEFGLLENLQVLDLSRCQQLLELPDVVTRLPHLRELDLEGCRFENLPPSIGNLQRLSVLHLARSTRLSQLPDEIGNLTNLTRLVLSDCRNLVSLPPSISKLTNLKDLQLRRTLRLLQLPPTMGDLERLETLNLTYSAIQALPPTIGKLKHLQCLHLIGLENLEELPHEIGKLTHLTLLEVREAPLQSLPRSMQKLTNLEYLGLELRTLTLVSEEIIGHLSGLQYLRLSAIRHPGHRYSNAFGSVMELAQRCPSLGWITLPYGILTSRETTRLEYALACNRGRTEPGRDCHHWGRLPMMQ